MQKHLQTIVASSDRFSEDGFPLLSVEHWKLFLAEIPHLFCEGQALLSLLSADNAATQALKQVTYTANITAPSDLWLLRHILGTYHEIGLLKEMQKPFHATGLAEDFQLDPTYLAHDLEFLRSRGLLETIEGRFSIGSSPQVQDLFTHSWTPVKQIDPLTELQEIFQGRHSQFLSDIPRQCAKREKWYPTIFEIEYGFRLLPVVLAVRKKNIPVETLLKSAHESFAHFLKRGGLLSENQTLSSLGKRVFERGPGPMGIIFAYSAYLKKHAELLHGNRGKVWVARAENIVASREANAKTFHMIQNLLDRYCAEKNFSFSVFIEHAVGTGEATRQRFKINGEDHLQYFGADLEDASIDRALQAQSEGLLPKNMRFVRNADIGKPDILIKAIREAGFKTEGAVMVVGNGFHEIRQQTNEKIIAVFRGYRDAGIVLIFTEESALTTEDLLATAWNTYHAGFRYTHAISGQGLRPSYEADATPGNPILSWEKCAVLGGYRILKDYSSHTRRIFPCERPAKKPNPAISSIFFAVPAG